MVSINGAQKRRGNILRRCRLPTIFVHQSVIARAATGIGKPTNTLSKYTLNCPPGSGPSIYRPAPLTTIRPPNVPPNVHRMTAMGFRAERVLFVLKDLWVPGRFRAGSGVAEATAAGARIEEA